MGYHTDGSPSWARIPPVRTRHMPRSIWSGTIGFGLVSVPVSLMTATKSRDVRFHQLEEGTGARIRYRKVSDATGEEVPNDQIVRGFEVTSGQYVVLHDEETATL